jgi:hypothetical protein
MGAEIAPQAVSLNEAKIASQSVSLNGRENRVPSGVAKQQGTASHGMFLNHQSAIRNQQ